MNLSLVACLVSRRVVVGHGLSARKRTEESCLGEPCGAAMKRQKVSVIVLDDDENASDSSCSSVSDSDDVQVVAVFPAGMFISGCFGVVCFTSFA
jgi:hypothetical protein